MKSRWILKKKKLDYLFKHTFYFHAFLVIFLLILSIYLDKEKLYVTGMQYKVIITRTMSNKKTNILVRIKIVFDLSNTLDIPFSNC